MVKFDVMLNTNGLISSNKIGKEIRKVINQELKAFRYVKESGGEPMEIENEEKPKKSKRKFVNKHQTAFDIYKKEKITKLKAKNEMNGI